MSDATRFNGHISLPLNTYINYQSSQSGKKIIKLEMEEIADVAAAYSQEERKRGEQKSRESTTLSTLF